jgi:hypothetical protein
MMKTVSLKLNRKFSAALRRYQKVIREADPRPLPLSTIVECALMLLWGEESTKAERAAFKIAAGRPQVLRGLLRPIATRKRKAAARGSAHRR